MSERAGPLAPVIDDLKLFLTRFLLHRQLIRHQRKIPTSNNNGAACHCDSGKAVDRAVIREDISKGHRVRGWELAANIGDDNWVPTPYKWGKPFSSNGVRGESIGPSIFRKLMVVLVDEQSSPFTGT